MACSASVGVLQDSPCRAAHGIFASERAFRKQECAYTPISNVCNYFAGVSLASVVREVTAAVPCAPKRCPEGRQCQQKSCVDGMGLPGVRLVVIESVFFVVLCGIIIISH